MRLIGLCALIAAVSMSLCERRNPEVCAEPDLPCPVGNICVMGKCVQEECSDADPVPTCPAERPVCQSRRCQPCTAAQQCARFTEAPLCIGGKCHECETNDQCAASQNGRLCDVSTHTCRGCRQHAECPSKVCAKDNLLADLQGAPPIPIGTCVPKERIWEVDASACGLNPSFLCSVQNGIDRTAPERPYVLLHNTGPTLSDVQITGRNRPLKIYHVIGPTADDPPHRVALTSAAVAEGNTNVFNVRDGATAVFEGLLVRQANTGVSCSALGQKTEVHLVRSLIGRCDTAVVQSDGCTINISESWIGQGPGALSGFRANVRTLDFKNTDFNIQNSVLVLNGVPGTFGGIAITDMPGRTSVVSRIVNSNLIRHEYAAPSGAMAIDCNIDLTGRLAVVNSIIYNSNGGRHISSTCSGTYRALATNEQTLAQTSAGLYLEKESDGRFADAGMGDYHLRADSPMALRVGGNRVTQVNNTEVVAPATDMDGKPRGRLQTGRVSIGAFEAQP
jgi:hypothetical protein